MGERSGVRNEGEAVSLCLWSQNVVLGMPFSNKLMIIRSNPFK